MGHLLRVKLMRGDCALTHQCIVGCLFMRRRRDLFITHTCTAGPRLGPPQPPHAKPHHDE